MSAEANRIKNRRQHLARPGGSHDRLVALLARVLPAAIGLVAAVMILTPLSPRGEVSFLLDRNKVAVTRERLAVSDAGYRGKDDKGRIFLITADNGVQKSATIPKVDMQNLKARLAMNDGPANVVAPSGVYDFHDDLLTINGPVRFDAADGFRMNTENVTLDVRKKTAVGAGGISGSVPTGNFSADTISADLENRTITLQGRARLHMVPGKMRIPQ